VNKVTVNVFPGGFNWGLYIGIEKGFFARRGLTVEVQGTPNSVAQMTDFAEGKFDIAMTAFDNIVAYAEGQGQAPIGPQPEFFAFMASDSGFLSLVAAPGNKTIADLKGKLLTVDAFTTGYAFVLYEMMRRSGFDKDRGDYELTGAGGMAQRWAGLREGKHQATLLSAPYNFIAQQAGFAELAIATDVIGSYQGNVGAARRSWATQNRDKVIAYIAGYREAIDYLLRPSNRAESIAILRRQLPDVPDALLESTYVLFTDPVRGFNRTGGFERQAAETVLEIRSRYATPRVEFAGAEKYCDLSYLKAAG
jgi:ABC-type nitrate/sulfonate/bicarbonate transport system substrate-binding protein